MSVDIKVAADDKLQLVQTYFTDNSPSSDFFNITELPDTLSGGKNAFLIAGSDKLFPQSEVKVQVRDAAGNVCYVEYADGNPEYFEGISKVVAIYVYPNQTAFGPATITVLGQAIDVPDEWQFRFNVKWQKTININPSLPNTTRVRFYKRPKVDIVETLEPIYRIESGSKVASSVTASFANIKISQLETFAGDVKRVKVFRTSEGDISDFDLIQDILIESKELLTTFNITSSVKGNAGIFTNETLKLWNTGSLTASLTNDRLDNGLRLKGRGIFRYNSPLSFVTKSTYEFNLDAFYSSSTNSNLGVYISGSNNGIQLIGTLEGTIPVKNLEDSYFTFDVDKNEPTASLYLSQSQNEWHVANVSLKLSEDSAFSPNQINFISTMPTVIGNERYNFKFEFYDVNNNFVPVAVTQSALFTGGNNNLGGTLILISGSTSASNAAILALSQSVSGTIGIVTGSVNTVSASVSTVSASVSSVSASLSSSISASKAAALSSSFGNIQTLANGNFSGSFISDTTIFAPIIGGINGYISQLFKVGTAPSIYLDARQDPRKIFIGGVGEVGSYNSASTTVYMDSSGKFSLGDKLTWSGTTLTLVGSIDITGGTAQTQIAGAQSTANAATASAAAANNAATVAQAAANYAIINANTSSINAAATAAGFALINANTASIFTNSSGRINKTPTTGSTSGLYLGNEYMGYYNGSAWKTYMQNNGNFFLTGTNGFLSWNAVADTLAIKGDIIATNITATGTGNIAGWQTNATSISKSGIVLNSATPEILMSGSVSKVKIGTRNLVQLTGTDDQRTVYLGQGGVKITGDWDAVNSEYPSYITLAADSGYSKAIFFNKNVGYSSELVYMYALPYGAGSCLRIENGGALIKNYNDGTGYTGTGNGGYALQVGSISGTTATFTGDVTANTSDGRLKTNIIKIDSPLEKLSKINGVYFNWNETAKELNDKDTTVREVGFIAQEVKEVLPEIVKRAGFDTIMDESITDRVEFKSKSGEEYLTIQYEKVVPLLVECIKELQKEIEELKKNK
jgi:hypothetical protein